MKIVKRVLIALLSVGAICCAFFVDLFKFRASSNIVMYATEEKLNALEFFKMMGKYQGTKTPEALLDFRSNMIMLLALFSVVLLVSLVLIIISTFLKDEPYTKAVSILSVIGMISSLAMKWVFSPITHAVEEGAITIGGLSGTGLLDSFAKLDTFALDLAPTVLLIILTIILLSNVLFDTFTKKSK